MLTLNHVTKSFFEKTVLTDINLRLKNKQITALIGSNGAGKSTLIGLIMDYYRQDRGDISGTTVSVMPDTHEIYDDLTGYDFLKAMSRFKNLPDMSQALELSNRLGLASDLKKKIKSYSFGMRKKISFIQAALGDFDTYIFDEPTSGVDTPSALEMLNIVVAMKEQGKAILLTSHNLDELEEVSDYVYILDSGRVVKEGTVKQILTSNFTEDVIILEMPDIAKLKQSERHYSIELLDDHVVKLRYSKAIAFNDVLKELIDQGIVINDIYREHKKLKDVVYGQTG